MDLTPVQTLLALDARLQMLAKLREEAAQEDNIRAAGDYDAEWRATDEDRQLLRARMSDADSIRYEIVRAATGKMLYFTIKTTDDDGEGYCDVMAGTNDKELALAAAVKYLREDGAVPVLDGDYKWSDKQDPLTDPIEVDIAEVL